MHYSLKHVSSLSSRCLYLSQFAGEGPIPFLVKARDLMPEVTQDVAWQQIVAVFNDFMLVQLQQPGAGGVIATMVGATAKFVAPIIAAYEMEGSRHFNAPAQIGGPGASQCVQGGCVTPHIQSASHSESCARWLVISLASCVALDGSFAFALFAVYDMPF